MIDLSSIDSANIVDEENTLNVEPERIIDPVKPNLDGIKMEISQPISLPNTDRTRQQLILKMYLNEFTVGEKGKLKDYKSLDVDKLSDDELINYHNKFKYILRNGCNLDLVTGGFLNGISMFEEATKNFSVLKTEGLRDAVEKDTAIMDDFKYLAIEGLGARMNIPPHIRLPLNLIRVTMHIHSLNVQKLYNNNPINNKLNEINSESIFDDL